MYSGNEEPAGAQSPSVRIAEWLRRVREVVSGFEGQRYLVKWLFLSTAIGIVAGLGSVVFFYAIGLCTALFLGRMVGYMPPSPVGEGSPILAQMTHAWLLPLVTALGGLISGLLVARPDN
jgi:CIC family chloride channel protein